MCSISFIIFRFYLLQHKKLVTISLQDAKQPALGGFGGILEKKVAAGKAGGAFGKLLENKKPGALGGIGNAMEKRGGGGFGNLLDKKGSSGGFGKAGLGAFGKRGAAEQLDKDQHGILEGISSLHSWIKSQTMIRPNQKPKGRRGDMYDEVV